MKQGDLVVSLWMTAATPPERRAIGIVTRVWDRHRQTVVDVLWPSGLEKNVWDRHVEVLNEEG